MKNSTINPSLAQLVVFSLLSLGVPASIGPAATFRVSPDGDGSDGLSWDTAFPSISDALPASASGDRIWVKSATYNEAINLVPGIELYGGFDGTEATTEFHLRDPENNPTRIDATGLNSSVVTGASDALLDGLTITGGVASRGGGIACFGTSMTINNCVIHGNRAEGVEENGYGGGVYCDSGLVTLSNCLIEENRATVSIAEGSPETVEAVGGGVYSQGGALNLLNCVVRRNDSGVINTPGGAFALAAGGGIGVRGSATVVSCEISKNDNYIGSHADNAHTIHLRGGGAFVEGNTLFEKCRIVGNVVDGWIYLTNIHGWGAGLYLAGDNRLKGCEITENYINVWGINSFWSWNGFQLYGKDSSFFDHCTTPFDSFDMRFEGPATFINCILSKDGIPEELLTITYSNVQNGFPGEGNIDELPRFVRGGGGDDSDFRLRPDSPCIDAGTDTGFTTDLDGNPRPVDIPGVGRDGPGAFDMGAYEFQISDLPPTPTWTPTTAPSPTPTATPIPATPTMTNLGSDIDGDGKSDAIDLFILQNDWHKPGAAKAIATPLPGTDLNKDERIDAKDLIMWIRDWINKERE